MNNIYKCSSRASFVIFLPICLALIAFGCDSDSSAIEEEADECDIGETVSCDTESGNPGLKVCLSEGVYTECVYRIPKNGEPCSESDFGKDYGCACNGRLTGTIYCLNDSTYSECFCESSLVSSTASAGSGGQEDTSDSNQACPAPFACQKIEQGGMINELCVEGGMPPLCDGNADCVSEGLDGAQCLDIGIGTKVCLQVCSL
jgi:hypothetical protein